MTVEDHELEPHRPTLEALAFRMLGSASEAEEVVQEAFIRALLQPPVLDGRPLRSWLVRVTCNLARDHLRKRKVRAYHGPWLPEPVRSPPSDPTLDAESQLRLSETATLAWLVAAEALTPEQRAVFLLREVLEWEVQEVGQALERSPGAVRSLHLRARRALVDAPIPSPDPSTLRAHRRALHAMLTALASRDLGAVQALMTPDVTLLCDGGGEVYAAGKALRGAERVARVLMNLSAASIQLDIEHINGLPAVVERSPPQPGWPSVSVTAIALGPDGRICALYNVVAPSKLRGFTAKP